MRYPISRGRSKTALLQRGFALTELIIAISIAAILAIPAQRLLVVQMEESLASGSATYMQAVANAAQHHALLNFNAYANNTAVPGVAILLTPTVAELKALGRLSPGFPNGANILPTQQSISTTVQRTNCPGAACNLTILTCTTTAVTLGGTEVRYDLASTMVSAQNGAGGQSLQGAGNVIRGPVVNAANPLGNIAGVVCATGSVDVALYQRFLTVADNRDPNFQGALTVAGVTTLASSLNVAGATTLAGPLTTNGTLTANGAVTVNNNLAVTGTLTVGGPTTLNGATTINSTLNTSGAITSASSIIGADLTPTSLVNVGAACPTEGTIARLVGGAGLGACQGGTFRPIAIFGNVGAACAPEGVAATSATGTMLLCVNGAFRAMEAIITFGTPGNPCPNPGQTAIDTASNNETLICRANPAGGGNRWFRLRDLTSNLVFVSSTEIGDEGVLTKPVCSTAASMASSAIVNLFPKAVSSPDGGMSIYAVDNGATWTIKLKNGAGAPLTGTPTTAVVVAQAFCYYF